MTPTHGIKGDYMESWKPIKGYEGYYEISNFGNVRSLDRKVKGKNGKFQSLKGKNLKTPPGKPGYPTVSLQINNIPKTFAVHRLVAKHFIPKVQGKDVVNHIDGNKTNNHHKNLEWVTHSENHMHAFLTGLFVPESSNKNGKVQGENNYGAKLKESDVRFILENTRKNGGNMTTVELAKKFNVSRTAISAIVNRRTWKHIN